VLLSLVAFATPAVAQTTSLNLLPVTDLAAEVVAATAIETAALPVLPVRVPAAVHSSSHALPLLYTGMIAVQALDIVSTHQALSRPGTYEANPIFGSAGSLSSQIAMKAAATAGIIVLCERVKKTNRIAAIVTMVALNSMYATVAAHNFSIAASQPGR
jgi:hypothetical protein